MTYAVSWACFGAAGLLRRTAAANNGAGMLATALLLIGTFAPSLVALAMTAWTDGVDAVRALLDRVFKADVPARWYVFAVGYFLALKLAVALVHRAAVGAWPRFGDEPWYVIAAAIVVSTPMQAGEEIGWRGYALPRLGATMGFGSGSVVLGIAWGLWHTPLFFIAGLDNFGQSLAVFVAGVTALSVAMAWLYVNTGGSVLLTMVMHSAVNQTTGIVPSKVPGATNPLTLNGSAVGWLTVVLLWIAAASFIVRMRRFERCHG
ncbi:MAG: type II CAAX prenyl endopeptidase Rce1 family protein [Betaproteobacteria bacterium]